MRTGTCAAAKHATTASSTATSCASADRSWRGPMTRSPRPKWRTSPGSGAWRSTYTTAGSTVRPGRQRASVGVLHAVLQAQHDRIGRHDGRDPCPTRSVSVDLTQTSTSSAPARAACGSVVAVERSVSTRPPISSAARRARWRQPSRTGEQRNRVQPRASIAPKEAADRAGADDGDTGRCRRRSLVSLRCLALGSPQRENPVGDAPALRLAPATPLEVDPGVQARQRRLRRPRRRSSGTFADPSRGRCACCR